MRLEETEQSGDLYWAFEGIIVIAKMDPILEEKIFPKNMLEDVNFEDLTQNQKIELQIPALQPDIVDLFLFEGYLSSKFYEPSGDTFFHLAAEFAEPVVFDLFRNYSLFDTQCNPLSSFQTPTGFTLLHSAAYAGKIENIQLNMDLRFSIPKSSTSSHQSHAKRQRISLTDEAEQYNSDEEVSNSDELDFISESDSSISMGDLAPDGTAESETESVGSNMDLTNELSSNIYAGKDKTQWFDKFDTSSFSNFSTFIEPNINIDQCKDCVTPLDFFQLFFNKNICSYILQMTNLKLQDHLTLHPSFNKHYMGDISMEELFGFLGLSILTGVFHANRESLSDLYSEDVNKAKPIFKATMPRDRLRTILKFIRFDDYNTRISRVAKDKLAPIRYIFDNINNTLKKFYMPGTWVTIDEHLLRYKGKCPFRQYIPKKPDKYGIKIWVIADARTFYPISLEVYTGKGGVRNSPEDVVIRLASSLKPGSIIVGDTYFTSLKLTKRLLSEFNIGYLGTIRRMRVEIPRSLHPFKTRALFSSIFLYTDKHMLVSYIQKKTRNVFLLSNVHSSAKVSSGYKNKPQIILDYNKGKCGVDKLDQMLKEYRCYRTTARWPFVIFYDLIGISCQASWVLYSLRFPDIRIVKNKYRKEFLYELGKSLCSFQISLRKKSKSYQFCNKFVKTAITQILPDDSSNTDHLSEISADIPSKHSAEIPTEHSAEIPTEHSADIPTEHSADIPSEQSADIPTELSADIPTEHSADIPSEHSADLTSVYNYADDHSCEHPEIITAPIIEVVTNPQATISTSKKVALKRGRCYRCDRKGDNKFSKTCHLCARFICSQHSKLYHLCDECDI